VRGGLLLVVALPLDDAAGRASVPEGAPDQVVCDGVDRPRVEGRIARVYEAASSRTCLACASWSRTRASELPPSDTFDSTDAPGASTS
jgi:hypothetical protein